MEFIKTMKALLIKYILVFGSTISLTISAYGQKDVQPEPLKFQTVYTDNTYQPTGITMSQRARIFISFPNWSDAYKYALVEMFGDGSTRPYPNEYMNSWKPGEDGIAKWVCVQAVYIDELDYLWVVDPASPQMKGVYKNSNKLVKIDLKTDRVLNTYTFEMSTDSTSYINDVRIDNINQYAYLTNSSTGGIIVLNLKTGRSRQILTNHYSVKSDSSYTFKINQEIFSNDSGPVKINTDGIALSPDRKWLYYKPLTDAKLYRIETKLLQKKNLTDDQLASKVKDLGSFCTTDGMIFDAKGNLYLGDIENNTIVCINSKLEKETFFQDDRLKWPDSYAIAGGYLYVTCSQINNMPAYNKGKNMRTTPYVIYRIKL